MSKLIIVESPEKGRTIQRFLKDEYTVTASKGHIRDLPTKELAVDIEHDFKPEYVDMPDKEELIKQLRKQAAAADEVYLATDPDREGEAISWHLQQALALDASRTQRVTFNEITRSGVKYGMEHPRCIDLDLVDAQQTRRILDRIVGYKLSPFLWMKVRKGLSAGRVQSVVVWLVVKREREIRDFVPREYWSLEALLEKDGGNFTARFYGDKKGEIALPDEKTTKEIMEKISAGRFCVTGVKKSTRQKRPLPPYTTSTMQQDSAKRLGMRTSRTMQVAQKLYEGVTVEGHGEVGLITYMRTDSLRVADEAAAEAAKFIGETYGDKYLPESRRFYKAKNAQDAHEAIRPTMPSMSPDKVKGSLTPEQFKLYRLIWERFITSQMANCVQNVVNVELDAAGYLFRASGISTKFDGFTVLYDYSSEEAEQNSAVLSGLEEGDEPGCRELKPEQHFTQPPARYNEGTLVAAMEEDGIGRPSTYAPIISTIINREYVEREGKNFKPTMLGEKVTELLEEQFPKIVDVGFTANMENELDEIGKGERKMVPVLREFYGDFDATLTAAKTAMAGKRVKLPDPVSDVPCDKCGKMMVIKTGRFGKFLACPGYPECKNTKPYQLKSDGFCPNCGKPMVARESKNGAKYYGCTGYPDCKFLTWDEPLSDKCPQCGASLFKKSGKGAKIYCAKEGCGYSKDLYPHKKGAAKKDAETDAAASETSEPAVKKPAAKKTAAKKPAAKKTAAKKPAEKKTAAKKPAAKKPAAKKTEK